MKKSQSNKNNNNANNSTSNKEIAHTPSDFRMVSLLNVDVCVLWNPSVRNVFAQFTGETHRMCMELFDCVMSVLFRFRRISMLHLESKRNTKIATHCCLLLVVVVYRRECVSLRERLRLCTSIAYLNESERCYSVCFCGR